MNRVTLDANLASQFQHINQPVELCDPSGRVMGRFVPIIDMSQWEPLSPEITEEEIQRREQETESFTTEEVLANLRNLK